MNVREVVNPFTEPLPHDEDSERYFVGGLLRWPEGFDELDHPVSVDAVHNAKLRLIYAAMLDLREDDEVVSPVSVQARLKEKGWLKSAGEFTVAELTNEVLTGANVGHYAEVVVERHRARQAIAYSLEAVRDLHRLQPPADVIGQLENRLAEIASDQTDAVLFDLGEVADFVVADLRKRRSEGRTAVGVSTGFIDIDSMTSGFCPGEMFVIGARPSQGKTAIAVNMLHHAAKTLPALFVSLEMSRGQVVQRMLSGVAGVDSLRMRHAAFSDNEESKIRRAASELHKVRFKIADIPGATISDVIHATRQTKRKLPDLAVVAVDYLQLIRPEGRNVKQYDHVTDVSRRLKAMARSLNVCVVALCQLNRGPEARSDKRPTMSDLRDSGQIEQDADVIALLHRPEQNSPDDRPGEADVILCKVRSGPIGEVTLTFDKATTTFRNAAHESFASPPPGSTYSPEDF